MKHKEIHLLIVNGWSANSNFWTDFEQGLEGDYTLQVLDLNDSQSLEGHMSMIDHNVRPNTLLMGWSMGGALAVQYAASSPCTFLGLVTTQTNPCFIARNGWSFGIAEGVFQPLYELVLKNDMKSLHRQFTHLLVQGSAKHKLDRIYLKNVYTESPLASQEGLLSNLALLRDLDVRECFAKVNIPSLHIYGAEDALVSASVASEVKKINAKHHVKVIDGMAHLPTGIYRPQLQSAINQFVKF